MQLAPLLDQRGLTLIAVAKTGSLTAAAKRLFITQPAVSQQLKTWEKELGFPLLEHQGKKVTLTPAAQQLVKYLEFLQHENHKVLSRLQNEPLPLKLGATLSIGSFLLPQILAQMVAQNWPVTTQIGNTTTLLNQLQRGKLDAALVEGDFDRQDFGWEVIGQEDFQLFGSQPMDHPLELEDLYEYPLLVREMGSGTRQILAEWLLEHGSSLSNFKQIVEIGSPNAIIKLLKDGVGISFMYKALVKDELVRGQLYQWDVKDLNIRHSLSLVTAPGNFEQEPYQRLAQLCRSLNQSS